MGDGNSPIVGKLLGIICRATQACLDRNSLLDDVVKYTICLVARSAPDGEQPDMRSTNAPTMSIRLLLAAVILIETGLKCDLLRPSLVNRFVPAKQDWQPVSAMASKLTVGVVDTRGVGMASDRISSGSAHTLTGTKG